MLARSVADQWENIKPTWEFLVQAITRQFRFVVAGFLLLVCAQRVSGGTWKFLVYGDSRGTSSGTPINTQILGELATQTVAELPAFVLFQGDLVYSGSLANYNSWSNTMQSVHAAGIPICAVAGNHESADFGDFKSIFITPFATAPFPGMTNLVVDNSSFDGRSYSFEFKNAMFLCMDNYSNSSTSAHCVNQTFLNARLAARNPTTTPLVFAQWHEPAFKAGQDAGLENKPTLRNATWASLTNAGCRQVFNGHDHLYATARLDDGDGNPSNDTYQVVVGTAGAPSYALSYSGDTGSWTVVPISSETSNYGYMRVVVDDVAQTVSQTWVHRTGVNTYADTSSVMTYTYGPTWTDSADSGNWSGSGNWNTGAVPFNGAAVTFGTGGSTSVVDSVSCTVDTIIFNRATDFVVSSSGGAGLTINRGVTVTNTYTYTIAAPVTLGRPNTWAVMASGALDVSGSISGSNSLTKTGSGTLTLSGSNSYSGGTTVSNGCLLVTGSTGTGTVTVTSGATLAGNGAVGGLVAIASGAVLAPTGTLTINSNLTLTAGATLNYELGTTSDQTAVTGGLQLAGTLNVTDAGGFGVGDYTLITYTGTLADNGLAVGIVPNPGLVYSIIAGSGVVTLHVTTSGPPPGSYDAWANAYALTNGCPQCGPNADYDGTGMSNTNKFLAGFNPTNSAAHLHIIRLTSSGDDMNVQYLGANGDSTYTGGPDSRTNVLEFTTGMADGSYSSSSFASTGQTNILSGGTGLGTVTNMTDFGGATNGPSRYYRVRVLLP